ncbi:MAG: penicillin acylase family protein, partial [Rhodospirillaceae bacterium]|nr:penicillin acylase family protein [Rhodospirillaceae bacterium]
MKWLLRIGLGLIGAVLGLALLIAGYGTYAAYSALPLTEGTLDASGLSAPATITRDAQGVPWISAGSAPDAYMALGYVHAQDRFFQMEMMRRIGQGRLSEILGPLGLSTDKFMRTLGVYRSAVAGLPALDAETLSAAKAYTQGVNAFLSERKNALPLEFKLLFFTPEPWQIADSLVWQKLMGLQLSGNWSEELGRAAIIAKLGPERAAELWPDTSAKFPATLASVPLHLLTRLHAAMTDVVRPTLASNIWAVGPERTDTGKPYLANDPHLNFQSPNMWYLAGLSYPGVTLTGATMPGVPFHLLGHNGNVAWGFTTTHGDTQDLFIETVSDDGQSYQTPDGEIPFDVRDEAIKVRFGAMHVIRVRTTRHGPVVSDILPEAETQGRVLALSATLLAPDDHSSDAIFQMARAANADDFISAAARFHAPQQNLMYADTLGSIGYIAAGRIPLRRDNACDGLLPADGATGTCDWTGWAPFTAQPQSLNPDLGVLVNANNQVVPDDYPVMIAREWPEGYRAQRIAAQLEGRAGLRLSDQINLQQDQVSLVAREMTPLLVGMLPAQDRQDPLIGQLGQWDGTAAADRVEPLVFALWMERLKVRLFRDEMGDTFGELWGARPALIAKTLTDNAAWCDDVGTPAVESCTDQVKGAWQDTRAWMEANTTPDAEDRFWGHWHVARFSHPVFGNIPGLSGLGGFSITTGGDDHTVNRGSFAGSGASIPFRHR